MSVQYMLLKLDFKKNCEKLEKKMGNNNNAYDDDCYFENTIVKIILPRIMYLTQHIIIL